MRWDGRPSRLCRLGERLDDETDDVHAPVTTVVFEMNEKLSGGLKSGGGGGFSVRSTSCLGDWTSISPDV